MKLAFDLHLPAGDVEKNLPPVVMLHGMLDSRKTWRKIAPKIANRTGRKVYALDARNHGESPWSDRFSFDVNAEDLDHFLSEEGIPKAALVGHSMGGRTAIGLALKKPGKVEKLVVEDMSLRNFKPDSTGMLVQVINLLRVSLDHIPPGADLTTAKQTVVQHLASLLLPEKKVKDLVSRFDLEMLALKRDGATYSWQANLDIIEDMLSTDKIRQNLSGVYMGDALFLYGTKSIFKVEKDPSIPKLFPRARLLPMEGATHLVHFEFPGKYVEEVASFINGDSGLKAKY